MKKNYKLRLHTIDGVKDFVNTTAKVVGSVTIRTGIYVIDGKSIMGIFSLDLTKEVDCEVEADEEQIAMFEEQISTFSSTDITLV